MENKKILILFTIITLRGQKGTFLKLQRALSFFVCFFMLLSCNITTKSNKDLQENSTIITTIDTTTINQDSLRFAGLIGLIEQMDLAQCDTLSPLKEDLLLLHLRFREQNPDIAQHFVKGSTFRFDDGYTQKPMMILQIYTFTEAIYAEQYAEAVFVNDGDEDYRLARFANSLYEVAYLTDIPKAKIKFENLLVEWDKIKWDKQYK